MTPKLSPLWVAVVLVLLASTSFAQSRSGAERRRTRRARPPSYSLGYANAGSLANAVRLVEDERIRYLPGRPHHHGTEELVAMLRRASTAVARDFPGSRLTVGDMSDHDGGPIGHHASHQSGRDVDIAFYARDARGRPRVLDDYVSFNGRGLPIAGGPWRFDVARNWALVAALLEDPAVRVEHIFVSTPLRALLIAHARSINARPMLLVRAQLVMHQPTHALPHSNHFHVRIACPSGDAQCVEGVRPPPRARRRRVASARRPAATQHGRPAARGPRR